MLLSSAYRTKRWPRRSNSRSSSSSTRLLSSGESGPPCGVPSTLGLTSPFSITPVLRNARMSFSSRLSSTRLAIWQFVVIDSIEEFLQIKINHPSIALRDVLLRLSHGLMCRSSRSKPIAVSGERRVPLPLQNLHHRLLDEAIQHGWDAKLSHPSVRLRDFHPPHRFRFVDPVQQLLPNGRPLLLQIGAKLIDGHSVDARATFIASHLPQRFLQVCSLTYLLHDSTRVGWAFGFIRHRERFDVFPSRLPGFTRRRRWEVQSQLEFQPLVALEIHVLLASPLVRAFSHRSRLDLSVDSTFRRRSASLALPTT